MAQLNSDDTESPSSIELIGGGNRQLTVGSADPDLWQFVSLSLSTIRIKIQSTQDEGFTLCRRPMDEAAKFVRELERLLAGERERLSFEPQEPSFELNFRRTHHGGIKVEAWIDSGNAQTGFYSWDAAGIRFFTSDELLHKFVDEIKREFSV